MYRVIIAGGRDFDNLPLLITQCDDLLNPYAHLGIGIISGKQSQWDKDKQHYIGADLCGELYANLRDYPVKPFPAQWDKYKPSDPRKKNPAGMIRNHEMGDYAKAGPVGGRLIAFWDRKSPGTRGMIKYADDIGLPFKVIYY